MKCLHENWRTNYNALPKASGGCRLHSTTRRALFSFLILFSALAAAQTFEQKTAHHFDSIRKQPPLLLAFLREMPKGGDLHNHLEGAIYAEDLIDFAVSDNLCVERSSSRLLAPPCAS